MPYSITTAPKDNRPTLSEFDGDIYDLEATRDACRRMAARERRAHMPRRVPRDVRMRLAAAYAAAAMRARAEGREADAAALAARVQTC